MNILLYMPNYLPATRYGGPIRSGHGLAKALVKAGHRVQVFTTDVDGPDRSDVPLDTPLDVDGVTVRYFATRPPHRLYFCPAMAKSVSAALADADVLHLNGCYLWPGPALARLARRAGVPYVTSPRGMLQRDLIAGKSALAKRLWIAGFERRLLATAGAIHATSEGEACGIRSLALDLRPVHVIGNGIDPPALPLSASPIWKGVPQGRRVAFLGRLDRMKGVDLVLQAAALVGGTQLRIAGPDPIGLRAALTNAGLVGPGVQFVGPLDDAAKWAFLAGADVLVAPSLHESFGIAVAEALDVGTPVITTPGVGISPVVAELVASCVVDRTPDALAHALRGLLSDPARCRRIADRTPGRIAREFGWPRIAGKFTRVYRSIASDHARNQRFFGDSEPELKRAIR
ncbi:MAG: glycosyltransferase [Rhodobacteraceae bacterium]|nr:glycosyltransferase [Paracoccaceae bacterium]